MTSWSARILAHFDEFKLDVTIDGDDRPLAIVGANGSGKTTFLRTLTGAVPTEQSEIVVGDVVLASNEQHVDLPIEQRRIGYVPQGYGLFPHLDALDNVAFGVTGSRSERRERAQAILRELDCAALADRDVTTLSGGEQQRVALARALVVEPRLILLDEPLAALDATSRRTVREFLAGRLRTLSCPSVIVTHDVRDVIALDALVVVFDAGRVTQRGTIADLREAPTSDFVTEFVGAR